MISQSIAESPLNITSILNNFKSFIKQVYQKNGLKILKKKKGSKRLHLRRNNPKRGKTTST